MRVFYAGFSGYFSVISEVNFSDSHTEVGTAFMHDERLFLSCVSQCGNAILVVQQSLKTIHRNETYRRQLNRAADQMKRILDPPSYNNPRDNATARLVFLSASAMVVLGIIFIIIAFFTSPMLFVRALMIGLVSTPLCLAILWLIQKSRLSAAGHLLLTMIWLVTTVGAVTAGSITAPIIIGYLFVISLSGLVTNNRVGIFFTVLCIVSGAVIAIAEVQGRLPATIPYSPIERISVYAFFFLLTLILQLIIAGNTNRLLASARKSETQYKILLESIPAISYINSNDGDCGTQYISPQVQRMLGYSQDEFIRDQFLWKKILHPDDKERVLAESLFTFQTSQPFQMEYRLLTKENRIVWVRDEAILVRDEDSAPMYWLGIWTDITARKQAEEEQADLIGVMTKRTIQLQTAAEVSRAVTSILDVNILLPNVVELIRSHFDYYYVGIFLVDDKREWAILRAATGEMGKQMIEHGHRLAIGDSSMVGWSLLHRAARIALDVGVDAVQFRNPFLPLTRSEMALPLITHGEAIGAMTIQSVIPAAFSRVDITALQSLADQVANAIENARLFTERASLINELEKQNAELERFTYTVSHDLRSPLVTIRGFLGYLRQDANSNDLTRFDKDVGRIANAVDRMQALLNDLLELSRVGRIINPPENVAIRTIISDTVNLLNAQLDARKVRLKIQTDLPMVRGDYTRLIEIMQNLISNAIKFMGNQSDPQIEIGFAGPDKDGKAILFVRDNGIGIEPKYHERIFGLFNRLDPTVEGTGVGLTLVKRIIEVHGGRIWVESEVGVGTTFYFTLPLG
jgi:PAS domain S-box-containing protein